MKKKVFSKLLMGALLVASVSSFTSCKDYDDDINDLRSQINGLNTSLTTTVNEKIATVNGQITSLTEQLNAVKAAYAKADEGLQASLNALKADVEKGDAANASAIGLNTSAIAQNATTIEALKGELVNLKAADDNLTAAIAELKQAQSDANAILKVQGETLVALAATDAALEDKITDAKAQAANALAEAQKAQTAAQTVADNLAAFKTDISGQLATTNANVANLQKTVADNLATVNTKIENAVTALEGRIKTNEGDIKTLKETTATNGANITTINGKLTELVAKDTEILTKLDDVKKALEQADKDAAAAQKIVNDQLIEKIKQNLDAINALKSQHALDIQKIINDLPGQISTEVAKQLAEALPEALKEYMKTEDIKKLVADGDAENKTFIDLLEDRFEKDSVAVREYADAQLALTAAFLVAYSDSMNTEVAEATAQELTNAYQAADNLLKDSVRDVANTVAGIQDQLNDQKEGSLAYTIKQAQIATNDRVADLESFFLPAQAAEGEAAAALSIENLAEQLKGSTTFIEAMADAADEANGEILDMITSINLFANQHMANTDEWMQSTKDGEKYIWKKGYENFDHTLTFPYAVEAGKAAKSTWQFPTDYEFLGDYTFEGTPFTFTDGMYRSDIDSILVRVNPVNAKLTKENITLLNSRGDNLVEEGLVQVTGVQKYDRVITRASETGLWVIYFKLVDDQISDKFNEFAYVETGSKTTATQIEVYQKKIVYAVAVKNTTAKYDADGNAIDRFVVSEYDLDLAQEKAARDDRFFVDNVLIDSIHNRYIQTEEAPLGQTIWTDDKKNSKNSYRMELTWKPLCPESVDPDATPAKKLIYTTIEDYYCECWLNSEGGWELEDCPETVDGKPTYGYITKPGYTDVIYDVENQGWIGDKTSDDLCPYNAVNRWLHVVNETNVGSRSTTGVDNRHNKPFLEIDFGTANEVTIPIDFLDFNECGNPTPIKGFYVTLDQEFAEESNNSEVNAWVSYEYENVAYYSINEGEKDGRIDVPITLQKGNHGYIKIFRKNNVKSDIIGFRVYAVNLDGTLYDPDGRAFYVKFGKNIINHNLSFDVLVEDSTVNAMAVQNPVGGQNPIYTFNQNSDNDATFFNIPVVAASYNPTYFYQVEYTWREDNPAIRGAKNYSTAWIPEADTENYYRKYGETDAQQNLWTITDIFNFEFSENQNADEKDKTDGVNNNWTAFTPSTFPYNMVSPANVRPNGKTQSVRATIKKEWFNRLLDDATYKVRMTIKRVDGQTSSASVVNVIDIDITKVMPTGLPTAFRVNSLEDVNPVQFYMRPDTTGFKATFGEEINPWSITWDNYAENVGKDNVWNADNNKFEFMTDAQKWQRNRWAVDVRPYTMEEIFYLMRKNADGTQEVDSNYYFQIEKAGDRVKADLLAAGVVTDYLKADNKYKDSVAIFGYGASQTVNSNIGTGANGNKPGYYLPFIHYSHVGDGNHAVKAGYIYRGISAKLNEQGNAFLRPEAQGLRVNYLKYPLQNQDLMIQPVAFDLDGKTAAASSVNFKFDCALDKALTLVEWSAKKAKAYDKKRFMTDIKYRKDEKQVVLTKWMTTVDNYETVANAKTLVDGWYTGYMIANDDKLENFVGATLDHISKYTDETSDRGWNYKFFTNNLDGHGVAQGYFDANFKNPSDWKSLTELLADSVLKVVDLDPKTITISDFRASKTNQQIPDGTKLNYKVEDYFDFYYAKEGGDPATKSSEIVGIGFKLARTQLLPALSTDVYATISFPVVDVWNHERSNIKLYVRFLKPENQAARQAR